MPRRNWDSNGNAYASWTFYSHRIGWWENLQESPIFDGKKQWFPVDFPLNQSIDIDNAWYRGCIQKKMIWRLRLLSERQEESFSNTRFAMSISTCLFWWGWKNTQWHWITISGISNDFKRLISQKYPKMGCSIFLGCCYFKNTPQRTGI